MYQSIVNILAKIKYEKPLILNITNNVSNDFIANGLLSIGASPVMSKATQEIKELMKMAQCVVINIGTLDDNFLTLCHHTCQIANQLHKPIIFDPVGAGASQYRTQACMEIIRNYNIAILRGNASEIMSLVDSKILSKGVDTLANSQDAISAAQTLTDKYNCCVFVSGKCDLILHASQMSKIERGSALMPMVTGTGCLLSAVVAAFQSIEINSFKAATSAGLFYSVCGEMAEEKSQSPGTFKSYFIDALNTIPMRGHYEKN